MSRERKLSKNLNLLFAERFLFSFYIKPDVGSQRRTPNRGVVAYIQNEEILSN